MFFNSGKKYKKKHQRRLADQLGPSLSLISAGTTVKGALNGKNSLQIAGLLEGDVRSEMLVWILKDGRVDGNIKAWGVIVEGEVNGNIDSKDKTELSSGARVVGDISCKKLSVAEDAFFEGKVKMFESQEKPYTFVAKRKNKSENKNS
jgi:cytoskeletal protein CcmA (bactofilin family)